MPGAGLLPGDVFVALIAVGLMMLLDHRWLRASCACYLALWLPYTVIAYGCPGLVYPLVLVGLGWFMRDARRMVEMATDLIQSYLLLRDAAHSERKLKLAETFIEKMGTRITMHSEFILERDSSLLRNQKVIIG